MRSRSEFDYTAWEVWLATLPPERAAELRDGMALADELDEQYQKLTEERKDGRND